MRALANTTISLLGGTQENDFGELEDADTVMASGIPAALTEQSRQESMPETGTPRVVRFTVCRVSSDTEVNEEWRVRDERTNQKYAIMGVSQTGGFGMKNDLRIDLRRIT